MLSIRMGISKEVLLLKTDLSVSSRGSIAGYGTCDVFSKTTTGTEIVEAPGDLW